MKWIALVLAARAFAAAPVRPAALPLPSISAVPFGAAASSVAPLTPLAPAIFAPVAASEASGPYGASAPRPGDARKHVPTPEETARMRAEYLRVARDGEEIFDAPGWVRKLISPELKAAFQVAAAENVMIDFANGQRADVPASIKGDPVAGLAALRREGWLHWHDAAAREAATPRSVESREALSRLESMHRAGLIPAGFDRAAGDLAPAAEAYARLLASAGGKTEAAPGAAHDDVAVLTRAWLAASRAPSAALAERKAEIARSADAALSGPARAPPAESKKIYERSIDEAKDPRNADNLRHVLARLAGMRAGTLAPSPNLGRQLRPSCTLHMLRGLLAALGVKKDIFELAREARALLADPFIGSATAFDEAAQRRLFAHYGDIREIPRAKFFESLLERRRPVKIRLNIGDPVYQHTLILEGFYTLDGKTYAALRDSTSYFPTRMDLSDFARVLTDDPALDLTPR